MEHRRLGGSGLKVPALSLGTATFGGSNAFFERWGQTQGAQAQRMVDLCLDHGVTLFDTADVYSDGMSEQVLGQALKGKRHAALIDTGAMLGYFHIGESGRGYLGAGNIDFDRVFRGLVKAGYEGPITFESFSSAVVNPQLSGILAIWRNLWEDGADLARHAKGFIESGVKAAAEAQARSARTH